MKKLIVIGLFLNAALLAGRFWQEHQASAAGRGGQPVAQENGDCNGDGALDISDAVYILGFLFQGGPPPVAFAQTGGLTEEQKEILSHLSLVDLPTGLGSPPAKTIRMTGVNLQIVNGMSNTFTINGAGNLILGYQEVDEAPDATNFRTGSHNLIVGTQHNYSSYGGMAVGRGNTTTGPFGCVSGGLSNTASGMHASVSGGFRNTASGKQASVTGGSNNKATADFSSVTGGYVNTASGDTSSITGGENNNASGLESSITGGRLNTAAGFGATVSGGGGRAADEAESWSAGGLHEVR